MSHARITEQQLIAFAAGDLRGADAEQVEAHVQQDAVAARTVDRYRLARKTILGDDGVDPPAEVVEREREKCISFEERLTVLVEKREAFGPG